ncbi:hypothetical protein CRM22_009899 [Opisthorchis felineus]|uniref:Protein KTI12 homolog n=1 Tax=Opisthorchis felineus TaxID=147828 RepID=A0A4V3SCR7_OPIFE|nr:hypothetical protein CRM22_009899 [Opisthorchis felineus]
MPLILTCGYPCSGKSSVIEVLLAALQSRHPTHEFVVIPEPAMRTTTSATARDSRLEIYADSAKERELRGHHKSEIERALSSRRGDQNTKVSQLVVIMDAPNYIKGYRYELYCLAKSLKHPHLVLFCDTQSDKCREWNKKVDRYPDDLITDMIARFEPPQSSQRWDSPLLTIRPDQWSCVDDIDISTILTEFENLLFDISRPTSVKPNRSTQLTPRVPTDFLQELERATQLIVDHILTSQSMGVQSVSLPPSIVASEKFMPDVANTQLSLVGREVQFSLANLARAKRRYITLQRAKLGDLTVSPNIVSLAAGFLRFLATSEGISDFPQTG